MWIIPGQNCKQVLSTRTGREGTWGEWGDGEGMRPEQALFAFENMSEFVVDTVIATAFYVKLKARGSQPLALNHADGTYPGPGHRPFSLVVLINCFIRELGSFGSNIYDSGFCNNVLESI